MTDATTPRSAIAILADKIANDETFHHIVTDLAMMVSDMTNTQEARDAARLEEPGDVSATVKDRYPDLAVWLAEIERDALEAISGAFPDLPEHDARWLHFADRLDSWVWAKHHNTPMDRDGWPAATSWLHSEAQMLGVVDDWVELVRGMA